MDKFNEPAPIGKIARDRFRKSLDVLLYNGNELREDVYARAIPPDMQEKWSLEPLENNSHPLSKALVIDKLLVLSQENQEIFNAVVSLMPTTTVQTFFAAFDRRFASLPVTPTNYFMTGSPARNAISPDTIAQSRGSDTPNRG